MKSNIVYLFKCVWEFIKRRNGKKEKENFASIHFTSYLCFLHIGIKSIFHLHFIRGKSVPPTFERNA
jgi:hypothetical protein